MLIFRSELPAIAEPALPDVVAPAANALTVTPVSPDPPANRAASVLPQPKPRLLFVLGGLGVLLGIGSMRRPRRN